MTVNSGKWNDNNCNRPGLGVCVKPKSMTGYHDESKLEKYDIEMLSFLELEAISLLAT